MSTEIKNVSTEEIDTNARTYWKNQANMMGIDYPNNITTDKLKDLVQTKLAEPSKKGELTAEKYSPKVLSMRDEALRLVRFKIKVLDPNRQSWSGMWVTAGNANLTPITRAIYFIDEAWHAEKIIVDHLKSMKYTLRPFDMVQKRGKTLPVGKQLPMFEITELPPLTTEELESLKKLQLSQNTGQQEQD